MAKPIVIPDSPARNNRTGQPPGAADTAAPVTAAPDTPADKALTVATATRAIGRRLSALRRQRGLTQEELGWRAGYHRTFISQIERGSTNPTLATLFNLTLALEVPLSALCLGDGG